MNADRAVADRTPPLEVEAKLVVDGDFTLPDLGAVVPGLEVGPVVTSDLVATYHDSADLRLARNGMALRFRREDGRGLWTLKADEPLGGRKGRTLVRRELSHAGTRTRIPASLARTVDLLTGGAPVGPVVVLQTRRAERDLLLEGVRTATLCDDTVTVQRGPVPDLVVRELEVELVAVDGAGDPSVGSHDPVDEAQAVLHEIVRSLARAGADAHDGQPKLHRALGDTLPAPARLRRRATLGAVVQATVARSLRSLLLHEVGLLTRRDAEDVHGARVATRRLRSDLGLLRGAVDPAWLVEVRLDLRRLAAALGSVRDLDVLDESLATDLRSMEETDAHSAEKLLAALHQQRERALEALLDELGSAAHRRLLENLHAAVTELPAGPAAEEPAREALGRLTERGIRRLHRAARRVEHGAPDDALHAVRILAKRCRYAAELADPLVPGSRKVARAANEVQSVLGELNDASVAGRWLAAVGTSMDGGVGFLAGRLAAIQGDRAAAARRSWPSVRRRVRDLRDR